MFQGDLLTSRNALVKKAGGQRRVVLAIHITPRMVAMETGWEMNHEQTRDGRGKIESGGFRVRHTTTLL